MTLKTGVTIFASQE